MFTVIAARKFSSSSLHAFRVTDVETAPALMQADGTERIFTILGISHHDGWTELVGWTKVAGVWIDETLETWNEDLTDAEAFATSEFLPTTYTIAA